MKDEECESRANTKLICLVFGRDFWVGVTILLSICVLLNLCTKLVHSLSRSVSPRIALQSCGIYVKANGSICVWEEANRKFFKFEAGFLENSRISIDQYRICWKDYQTVCLISGKSCTPLGVLLIYQKQSNSDSMCLMVLIGGFLDSKFYRFDFLSRGIIKELVDESLLIKQIG